ncbi:MAG: penicillin-binding transpeptidase domain-containing protein [Candidatus Sumerlaeia bacterium]|nr:penicillin-binding transpeptidase domain-containing protein [Candidatus Sumerlaeia bacterium]
MAALAGVSVAVFVQLFNLAVRQNSELRQRSLGNLELRRRLDPPRGTIYDRDGLVLAETRFRYDVWLAPARYGRRGWARTLDRLEVDTQRLGFLKDNFREAAYRASENGRRLLLARGLSLDEALPLLHGGKSYPALSVETVHQRIYHLSEGAALAVGYLGAIPEARGGEFPDERYARDSRVGIAGIEGIHEGDLAGFPGVATARRGGGTETVETASAQPGRDCYLTLSGLWQEKAYEILSGRHGSIIVLDCDTGAIRVAASAPSFDPERPGGTGGEGETSFLFRAAAGLYPPGSTLKPFALAAILEAGLHRPQETIECRGEFRLPGWSRPFHCTAAHGAVTAERALKVSCNTYFYRAGSELGAERLLASYARFGFGAEPGLSIPQQKAGRLPDAGSVAAGELVNLSIGQGSLLATPLQVARAYASLANGGALPVAHLVEQWVLPDGSVLEPWRSAKATRTGLPAATRAVLIAGMGRAANESGGTASRAGFDPEWEVCGKTGTAENARNGVDAWFAGFYPESAPRHVVVVHIEDAEGHGGDIAAPLAAELIAFMERPDAEAPDLAEAAP